MQYNVSDFTVFAGHPNSWLNGEGSLFIGRDGQTIESFVEELNAPPLPPVAPIPQTISDRQFFQQLSIVGIISEADALAANAAVIPQPLLDIINVMPIEQQFSAKMLISGATVYERSHPMTIAIGTAYGWTPEQIDDFFKQAATL